MKKVIILTVAVLLCLMTVASFYSYASADWATDALSDVDKASGDTNTNKAAYSITGAILTVFRVAAVGIALIMLVAVAMKYMSAAPEGKAEIKKHAVIYVVGAIVLFASSGILGIIQTFAESNIKPS